MAVQNGMFIFEVVVENVQIMVETHCLIIRSEFADIFALELRDPKQMHIQMPEPLPLPPEPPGKGKKKKPPKPKKGKKGKEPPPPPEPVIQSGQSVLFTSNADFLIQNMGKYTLDVSLWNKDDNMVFVGSNSIPWDPIFLVYLQKIANGVQNLEPPVLRDSYNIFEENTAKIIAKLALQVKLSFLGDKVCTAFRTLTEDPVIKKVLYTGLNDKNSSFMCTYKTTDEDFEQNCNRIENKYIVDKQAKAAGKIQYADFTNAPGANLTFFNDGDYCCMNNADKPPESKYKAPETCPDIDFIIDYVRKIIVSCNDNMRMLTPRPTIKPRVKATDIDRLCYCRETEWPPGTFAARFKEAAQSEPCPLCIEAGKRPEGLGETFDIANIRGPCGRPDCRIARDMRAYIEKLVDEDNKKFDINELVGPCGSKTCTLAEKIQEFIRHEGVFARPATIEGLSTQCGCIETMQKSLERRTSCTEMCGKYCESSDSEASTCGGKACPFNPKNKSYNVYYFTVELDDKSLSESQINSKQESHDPSQSTSKAGGQSGTSTPKKFPFCSSDCVSSKSLTEKISCTKSTCSTGASKKDDSDYSTSKCQTPVCPSPGVFPPSPADSDVVISFKDIHNPCCVKTCDVAEKVKEFISDAVIACKRKAEAAAIDVTDPCYCDCVCTFKLAKHTTYCAICGGYECLGDDMADHPSYIKPHPCPIYNKLYDTNVIRTKKPFPEDEEGEVKAKSQGSSAKTSRSLSRTRQSTSESKKKDADQKVKEKEPNKELESKGQKAKQKKVNKFTANDETLTIIPHDCMKKPGPIVIKYPYPPVPKNMGWNWTADDIPGMKPRPNWKPGAANRILVRRYRTLREGSDTIAKKKRAMMQKKKKIESKPTLIVSKKDGEYTVQMEVFKKYSKERLLSQYPYDDKPPLFYTIGKTEAEKKKIRIQRERRERRETRRKSRLIQSTFRDKCQEICLKAYNQAIGVLSLPNLNDPECPCQTAPDPSIPPPVDSCSCSDEGNDISTSDTDNDEWTVEFTAPAAKYDGKAKNPPVLVDSETQYTYLDYKVKVLDKSGNQVPRFFKGMDGKEVCSDLGGFWSPDHVWMEINKDGYIGPDNRWVPMNFIGPDGMFYSSEEGCFTDTNGKLLKIGIDGYINQDGKWTYYSNREKTRPGISTISTNTGTQKQKKPEPDTKRKADAKGKETAQAPTKGKTDKKESSPPPKPNKTETAKTTFAVGGKPKNALVLTTSINFDKNRNSQLPYSERIKIDAKKVAKYQEIMQELQMYEDFYDLRPLMKTNRATQNNTMKNNDRIAHKKMDYNNKPFQHGHKKVDINNSVCYYGDKKLDANNSACQYGHNIVDIDKATCCYGHKKLDVNNSTFQYRHNKADMDNAAGYHRHKKMNIDKTRCYYGHKRLEPVMSSAIESNCRTRSTITSQSYSRCFEDKIVFT